MQSPNEKYNAISVTQWNKVRKTYMELTSKMNSSENYKKQSEYSE